MSMGTSAKDEQDLGLTHEDLHTDGEDRRPGSLFQEGELRRLRTSHELLGARKGILG